MQRLVVVALLLLMVGCGPGSADERTKTIPVDMARNTVATGFPDAIDATASPPDSASGKSAISSLPAPPLDTAIFAGGCFWCMEPPYDKLDGVLSTISGYTAGSVVNPTYEQVSAGGTGHTEALQVIFDPARVSYDRLLYVFWRNIDPLASNRQFCDNGSQYRSGIYPRNASQKTAADASLRVVTARFRQPITTEILAAMPFYAAEEYHQNYYTKNPLRYKYYRSRCGRDARLEELWGSEAGR